MTAWSDLLSSALVGTDRRPAPDCPLPGIDLPAGDRGPGRLLDAAAAATVARRAGLVPERVAAVPPAAPGETAPCVPQAAARRLRTLLASPSLASPSSASREHGLLAEWLGLARKRALRVPGSLLPDLFAVAERRPYLRPLVAAVGGHRARWLADLRPDWAWVRFERAAGLKQEAWLDEAAWLDGDTEQRTAYLTALRETDPDRAREMLVEAWPQEPADVRASLLTALAVGIGMADEDVCEAALDDRRREVRSVAADLLAILPGSAYQRRMIARSRRCVTERGRELVVTPPSTLDESMRRDGLVERPPRRTGERAWWVEQIIGRTPLSTWDHEPAALLARPVADEWCTTLHGGWARAAITHRDARWAYALVRAGFREACERNVGQAGRSGRRDDTALLMSLYEQLGPADATALALAMLERQDGHVEHVLPRCPRPWGAELAAAVLTRLRNPLTSGHAVAVICAQAASGLSPEHAEDVRRMAEARRTEREGDAHLVDRLAGILAVRHQMLREFA
jgi:hypothetical protein